MAIGSTLFSIGATTGNPLLMGAGAASTLVGGLFNYSASLDAAEKAEQTAELQNEIYGLQYEQQKTALLDQKRELYRQSVQKQANTLTVGAASGQTRSSSYQAAQTQIEEDTAYNAAQIDTAIEVGEQISDLNQEIVDVQSQTSNAGFLGALFS